MALKKRKGKRRGKHRRKLPSIREKLRGIGSQSRRLGSSSKELAKTGVKAGKGTKRGLERVTAERIQTKRAREAEKRDLIYESPQKGRVSVRQKPEYNKTVVGKTSSVRVEKDETPKKRWGGF